MDLQPWLITGAGGFLGLHVVEQLLSRGVKVVGLDNLAGGNRDGLASLSTNPLFKLVCGDIRDGSALSEVCSQERPAVVVHLAALHFIPDAMRDPAAAVSLNVHGTQAVLNACRIESVRGFWFASTGDVYQPSDQPHHESSAVRPFNVYGETKWTGEQLVRREGDSYPDRHSVIGRLFNLYGPRETSPHILPEIIQQIRVSRDGVLRLGNITPTRDLVPVSDAARAVVETMEKSKPGLTTVNIGTGASVSVQEVVDRISALIGKPLRIETDPGKVRPIERPHLQADVGALRNLIGWSPHRDLSRGLYELLRSEGIVQ
jgi:UDP-glucose 4-epimerase